MGKDQELVQAIRNNDVGQVKNILAKFKTKSKKTSKKGGVHIVDPDGFTPLHHAALSGNGEIVMALLEHVNDVNVKDKKGMTPLHLASWAGKVEPALLLLDAGAQTNLCSRSGATPLHLASEHGNYVVVERLVDHDCDPTVVNNQGETALDLACRFGHLEAVRILLNNSHGKCEKLLNPKEFQEKASPLHMAAKTGHYDVVKLLVENGADISQKGPDGTCLHEAALYGKTDIVKYLIEAGIDVNIKNREGQTALDMVSQFIKSGACSEIKHLLREASVEVVYAKAIRDYCNIKDESFLTLRLGDIVLVLDRRKDGMWKGCVRDDQKERIGFFPSSAVKVLRSPSRNSVRSSTSSTDGLKVSTTATVSNTFEIVTVATPNQPVAAKSRAPKMSSFRKKAAPKSTELSSRLHSGDGRTAAPMENGDKNQGLSNGAPRTQSEGHLEERKKKLNYLDIVLVEKHNSISQREGPSSAPPTKTEYADVWLPKTNFMDATDGARTAHVHERRERLNTGQLQQRPEQERLRQELQRQQEQRQHRPEEQWRTELQQQELQRREHERLRSHGQHPPMSQLDLQAQQPCPPLPAKSRHYTMSSLSTNSEDLPALPLKKRHSLSGRPLPHTPNEPSIPLKLDKKVRTSFRGDRRGTSPPPPPPPPPVSSTPSPVSTDVSPEETKPPPPIAKSNRQNNVGPVFQADETSSNVPHQASLSTSPSPPPPLPPPASPPSPSLSPPTSPPPAFPPPAPPPPPPSSGTETETLTSPSTSSLGDFPPPPPSLIAETPENEESKAGVSLPPPDADYAPYRPRQNTCPLTIPDSDGQNTPKQEPLWGKVSEIRQASTLPAPNDVRSRTGYEDMSRLKRTWTKPEVLLDKKGYVVVTPVNRPPSPVTPAPKVETSSSLVYENFTPLRARLQYQQRSQSEPVYSSISGQDSGASEQPLSPTNKPEKPCRHRYVNCEVSEGHRVTENKQNENNPQDTPQNSPENCSNISDEVPPPPISFPIPTSTPASDTNPNTNPRLSEYDDLYEWLAQSKLLTYMDNFAGAGFDLSAITGLTGEDLSEMEITKTGHRKRLLSEAAKLPRPDLSPKNDVPSWLAHLGLSRYEGNFMDGGFDDIEFLNDLSLEDLRAIGITRLGHQRKILMAVQRLQQRASSESSSWIVEVSDHTKNMKEQSKVPLGGHGSVGGSFTRDSENSTAGLSVGEYAVPRVSHYNEIKPVKTESDTDPSDEIEWAKSSSRQKKTTGDISAEGSGRIIEAPQITFAEEDRNMESCVDNAPAVNGTLHDEDNVDGVKELAASFQHAIRVETEKAKGKPPPVKPKVFKKPPPVVAPKPKPAKHKVDQVEQNSADVNAKVDFTEVIKEAEALSESGSESPPSTLGRGQKSESGVSLEGSLNTNTSGSQGSLNSESEDFQREIKESLHQRKPSHTSAEDIHEQLTRTLTLSQEDLLEQQKLEEEVQKYQSKQNKTDMLFTDIQGMLDNLNTELDDMFK